MSNFLDNVVNQQFRQVYRHLDENNLIKGKSDIAKHLGTYNHVINSILKGKRNITVDQINRLVEVYGINANFVFGNSDTMFTKDLGEIPASGYGDRQYEGRNNITLVPQKAMAGYALGHDDFEYWESLQKFSIPGIDGSNLIAFEISGDSMMPTITNGDTVICELLEPGEPIRDNNVYVIVTDVVVAKRIHQMKRNNQLTELRLISDNPTYQPYNIEIGEVRQLLRVKGRLTNYSFN
ncbi:MAG: S24 family peptidase [Bacteroidota bacterium]